MIPATGTTVWLAMWGLGASHVGMGDKEPAGAISPVYMRRSPVHMRRFCS